MEKRQPLVSVVTPTYKREPAMLQNAINYIKAQTYKNIEHIIIDDNPPDSEHRAKIAEFMKKYENDKTVVYLQHPKNMGGCKARNTGIFAATGEYITFLDDDDAYKPEKVEVQVNFMMENDCDMSFSNITALNLKGQVVDYRDYSFVTKFDKTSLLRYHVLKNLAGTDSFMYRAEALHRIGGFDDVNLSQEYMLMLKSIESDLKIRYLNRADIYGPRDNSMPHLSQGMNKINGEKRLFEVKKKYYHLLTLRERMYVRFRHQAIMAYAYKNNKMYGRMLLAMFLMVVYSPIDCVVEGWKFVKTIFERRRTQSYE